MKPQRMARRQAVTLATLIEPFPLDWEAQVTVDDKQ